MDNIVPVTAVPAAIERLGYRPRELAQACGLSESFIRTELAAGRLRGHRVGKAWVVLREDAEAWIRSQGDRRSA